mmetsp:Transcript_69768/g.159994  ORF Transcript_69768/g.159994 Transcript_69768/m.159994 type:complete len:229 (-) Transcript_69768:11-697(-)
MPRCHPVALDCTFGRCVHDLVFAVSTTDRDGALVIQVHVVLLEGVGVDSSRFVVVGLVVRARATVAEHCEQQSVLGVCILWENGRDAAEDGADGPCHGLRLRRHWVHEVLREGVGARRYFGGHAQLVVGAALERHVQSSRSERAHEVLFVFGEIPQETRFGTLLDLDFAGELELEDHNSEALHIRAGWVSRLVVEVDVVVGHFIQRHCADGAEKGKTRERSPRSLSHA